MGENKNFAISILKKRIEFLNDQIKSANKTITGYTESIQKESQFVQDATNQMAELEAAIKKLKGNE